MSELNEVERKPHFNRRGDWFYVDEEYISVCSGNTPTMIDLSTSHLLRTLAKAGILARWDMKQNVLMPKKPKTPRPVNEEWRDRN